VDEIAYNSLEFIASLQPKPENVLPTFEDRPAAETIQQTVFIATVKPHSSTSH